MTIKNVHYEGQADGTSITVANSAAFGDDALDVVSTTNGTIVYSSDGGFHGNRSARYTCTAGATTSYLAQGLGGFSTSTVSARAYFFFNSYPSTECRILAPVDASYKDYGGFNLAPNGTVRFCDVTGAGLSLSNSATQVTSLNSWYRFEAYWTMSPTAGSYHAAVYEGDSTSPWFSYTSAGNVNTGTATIRDVLVGKVSNPGAFINNWYVNDFAAANTASGFIGPYVPGGPSIATTVAPGFARIDATGSRAVGSGALNYSISPSTNTTQPSPGIFFVPQSSSAVSYTLTVTEAGGGSTARSVAVPGLASASSSQTTVMTQKFVGGAWV